ncbi:hypothetical protein [Halodesulfovibrio aestuarii]|uniref:HEPN domain-containing protein n=1 Tax=Halodesulfovibrio aestuarii TaxID=126333 RepID=A0ABV4JSW3_9BACT
MGKKDQTSAAGLHTLGEEFLEACKALDSRPTSQRRSGLLSKHARVQYYLVSHSLELFLKAALLIQGYSVKKVRAKGHNLEAIFKAVNLTFSNEEEEAVMMIAPYYHNKELEYPNVLGGKRWPHPSYLILLCERLKSELLQPAIDHYNKTNTL